MFAKFGLACVFSLMLARAALAMPQIWLAPLDNLPHPPPLNQGAWDYQDLFAPNETWTRQLPQVRVFKIYGYFIGHASDAELRQLIGFLRAHHIKLALEMGILSNGGPCGGSSEGYNGEYVVANAKRIKRLGGEIDYMVMDEPLFYGHEYSGPRACHYDVNTLAADAAKNVLAMQAVMPGLQVGQVEVAVIPGNWAGEIGAWTQAFQAATGEKLAFMQFDVNWSYPWLGAIAADAQVLHAQGIPYGVIFNGIRTDPTDAAWAAHVQQHYMMLQNAGIIPDQAVFQTWVPRPSRVLPVSDPASMTGIIHAYIQQFKQHEGG